VLFRVTYVSANHAGPGRHRYYGEHCMGGYYGAYENTVSRASRTDRKAWKDAEHWRGNTKPIDGRGIVAQVEGG
jgi:hypothetical protein